jgi:hypothetical protein
VSSLLLLSPHSFYSEKFFDLDLFFSRRWCGAIHNVVGRHCMFLVTLVYAFICTHKSLCVQKIQFMLGSSIRAWFIMFLSFSPVWDISAMGVAIHFHKS